MQATHHLCTSWRLNTHCVKNGVNARLTVDVHRLGVVQRATCFWSIQHQPTLKFKRGDVTRLQRTSHIIDVMPWYRYIKLARSHYEISQTVTAITVKEDRLLDSCVGLKRIQISWNDPTLWKNLCILLHLLKKKWLQTVIVLKKARNLNVRWGGGGAAPLHFLWCFACD